VLKIRPPLVFHRDHADLLVDALGEVLAVSHGLSGAGLSPAG